MYVHLTTKLQIYESKTENNRQIHSRTLNVNTPFVVTDRSATGN